MATVLIISDTHSYLDPRFEKHIKSADFVWHAGDIGKISVMDEITAINKRNLAVFGNIDDHQVKAEYPLNQVFTFEGKKIVITHIAGSPNRYKPRALDLIKAENPDIFICGHSHVLKVMYDKTLNHLHINPGAAGKHGFHKVQTAIKITINKGEPLKDLEIIELNRKS